MTDTTIGFVLLVLAGLTNGTFTLPMKFTRKWAWENTWLAWTVFALLILPPVVTLVTIPRVGEAYAAVGGGKIATTAAFGLGWGVAQVLFGLAVETIGVALTFSIVLGLSAALGSVIPLVRLHPEKIATTAGLVLLGGVGLLLVGVAICAVAGRRREAAVAAATGPRTGTSAASRGLLLAVLCGLLASLINLGLAFGQPIIDAALAVGAEPVWAPNAVWLPIMLAGAIPNLAFVIHLLRRNGTASKFRAPGTGNHWALAFAMAILWFASNLLYGVSASRLGELGPIIGWPLFMSLIVITASVVGILTGEWKAGGKGPLRTQLGGVAFLIVAVFVLGWASR